MGTDSEISTKPVERAAAGQQGFLGGLNPLVQIGRLLPTALQDLRSIADSMRLLPDLLSELAAIRARTEALDQEVRRMRQGVDRLDGQVVALRESVDAELHEVGLAVHPVRRMTRRLGRRSERD